MTHSTFNQRTSRISGSSAKKPYLRQSLIRSGRIKMKVTARDIYHQEEL